MAVAAAKYSEPRRDARAIQAAIADLAKSFGNRLVTSQVVRDQHAHTLSWLPRQPPDGVVFVQTMADIQDAMRICAERKVPVTPRGAGSGMCGGLDPVSVAGG